MYIVFWLLLVDIMYTDHLTVQLLILTCNCSLLNKTDWFTQGKAASSLTAVLEARPDKESFSVGDSSSNGLAAGGDVDHAMKTFIDWLCSQLR